MEPHAQRLTTHQKAVLIQVLLTFPVQQVRVCYDPAANDVRDYAQDFLTIFKVIGWDVSEGAPANNWKGRLVGLAIVVSKPNNLVPSAEALRDALRIYGIEVATIYDLACEMKDGAFILSIGPGNS
jgi:hypothetical protein